MYYLKILYFVNKVKRMYSNRILMFGKGRGRIRIYKFVYRVIMDIDGLFVDNIGERDLHDIPGLELKGSEFVMYRGQVFADSDDNKDAIVSQLRNQGIALIMREGGGSIRGYDYNNVYSEHLQLGDISIKVLHAPLKISKVDIVSSDKIKELIGNDAIVYIQCGDEFEESFVLIKHSLIC